LVGRDVVIWPDNDEAGLKYPRDVIESIRAIDPATPISVVNVEALYRAVCVMKGWLYDDQISELKGWDAADVATLGLDTQVIVAAVDQAIEPLHVDARRRKARATGPMFVRRCRSSVSCVTTKVLAGVLKL
jgi:hypothetical protein